MGSLSSRPDVPAQAQQQVIYYAPAPAQSAPPSSSPQTPDPTPEETAAAARKASLLQRGRGRFGTIQTSFRGLLDLANSTVARKTLLGE